ncbi:peptide chain release factor N(5)-glutamine methyltransferase [Bacteroides pyogenes]|uniref:peptide chain release factor N(5)-glutamine methyltransferase n=1 Tax=Bacteroides pyogenes TaxID=310300 RepID=UPI0011E42191|nr:peptide chain release factor N(5)-glutamine methyltransferase [Bacteroides pyogenes]MBR8708433.1 Release factor glutamine methyltransferase [Bacteroides pyogenes]MBR8717029.1 Release factor glutamine methyltransferase [Bacteroides pyogenes]MBR8746804.1 Release factor glutamine methyltransferase [Bacteroides pyogenes]MBR8757029.1 Release factor glutamine methyltransferase [Bacteroides pyogenes]MBR8780302.1 Release factor glutamine methyltransferase [Bacteroides pyogenes]
MNQITAYIRQSLQELYPPEELRALSMLICCDMLGVKALDIYMGKDIILSESKQRELENIVSRLRKNEPIQYIRGYAEFGGRSFRVAPGVLIPRPETAELVDLIVRENPQAARLLDIGTGSGCIAISLDKRLPEAAVDAWDVSEDALAVARANNKELEANVALKKIDVLSDAQTEPECEVSVYDVIVSNPPYVTECEKQTMEPNVLEWEPEQALFVPDSDPLRFYRRIAALGRKMLLPEGKLYFEINRAYGRETALMLEGSGYGNVRVIKDMFGNDRMVAADL